MKRRAESSLTRRSLSSDHLSVITGPMQSAGGERGGEEGREESVGPEGRDEAAEECGATVPPAQEVCDLRNKAL